MIGIINYGAGNIFSLTAALERLKIPYGMIHSPEDIDGYDRYIIPGVGHAGAAMHKLNETGLVPVIRNLTKPVLGICVGMQLLTSFSEEGNSQLTGIVPINTLHFSGKIKLKVPHTGWNNITIEKRTSLFDGIDDGTYFYFVHSYFIEFNPEFTLASAGYEIRFSAAIQKGFFYGVQFHPEKSGEAGEHILKNFSLLAT
ncbi:imidazole glycerol phosphate synthase subunit HisH [Hufsiella ginkgonis]|uniref:Imidazole glycerol phosphate synthase subunit HisH n=1 Tax=Hufsiella ginkgonis TaxID=2695274 RepID=A0A7K1XWH4_9SPHI|nr:imidazole glycerol phosphate synthase subunit HisH [Hufsiella ginkgonis]MXV15138.1 imidazole glycerol phosphate synthase subunit HisH [Hufsiella ginkgonis]